jgi:hypothetical protein
MTPLCRHILTSGPACRQPALKGKLFCRFHNQVKKLTRRHAAYVSYTLPFVFPDDHAALQLNAFIALQALTEGRIDTKTAHAINSLLRTARISLAQSRPAQTQSVTSAGESRAEPVIEPVQRVILTPEGEEVAPPRIALEPGEQPPVHDHECACPQCAEKYRNEPHEQHHKNCQCGLCEETTDPQSAVSDQQAQTSQEPTENSENTGPANLNADRRTLKPVLKTARAEKLYTFERAHSTHVDSYEEVRRKYEARRAARERAAEAGTEPPPGEPVHPSEPEDEAERRYQAIMEQVEKNKQIANEIWERRFAHEEEQEAQTNPLTAS